MQIEMKLAMQRWELFRTGSLSTFRSLAWQAHRKAHPERRSVTGSWRRMRDQAEATYARLAGL